jgi:hypothetical protein
MPRKKTTDQFLFCINNDAYPASLEVRKVYRALPDAGAAARGFVRVIDESGEDYLYPVELFVTVELPRGAAELYASAPRG